MIQILQSFKSGELWLAETPAPICKSGGVVLCTRVSFVSAGTERMLVDFAQKSLVGKAMAMPDQVKKVIRKMKAEGVMATWEKVQTKLDQPIPLGYSCAGVVEEVGRAVAGLKAGDRVACGGAGYANHAEYNYVPKNLVVRIPDAVSFEDASCATVGSIALQGVRQCDVRLGEAVCVMGLGLLGMFAVQMLKAAGCRVLGFDPNPARCQLAKELGADLTVSSDLAAATEAFSGGNGVDAVLITAATKSNEPVTVAGEIARHRGKVVVTGVVGMDIPRDQYYKKELDFKLSLSYGPGRYDHAYEEGGHDYPFGYVRWTEQRNIEAFLRLVASGAVTPGKLITHRFEIDHALEAYDLLLGKTEEPYFGITLNYGEKASGALLRKLVLPQGASAAPAAGGMANLAFIGAGNFSKGVLLPKLRGLAKARLVAVCAASGMNSAETGRKEGFEYACTDYQEMLKDSNVNAVFVTTQHNSHAKFAEDCLRAGKHVFVEKPLAIDAEQLDGLVKAYSALEPRPLLSVGFNRRFSPHARLVKDYFAGRKTPLFINYRVNAGIVPADSWLQDPEVGGGRIVGELCHFIDLASFLTGSLVVEVQAAGMDVRNAKLVAEDNVAVSLSYADGSVASIQYVALGSVELAKERCEVSADESTAVIDDFRSTVCSGRRGRRKLAGKQAKGFAEELAAFVGAVAGGGAETIPFESLVNTTRCTFAVLEALRRRAAVPVG